MTKKRTLGILPALDAIELPSGRVILLGRFLSGMSAYREFWDGDVRAIIQPASETTEDRALSGENVEVDPAELDFGLDVVDYESPKLREAIARCDVVLAAIFYRQNHVSKLAREVGVPVIYNSEYTLRTRLQIARAEVRNPVRLARRVAWEVNQERMHRSALRIADGLQCCGVPTYEAYRNLTPSPLLYFDGRVTEDMLVPRDVLDARLARLLEGGPLRLTWAGRINEMKGADQLPEVAKHLVAMGVDFTLDIYGSGVLEDEVAEKVRRYGLESKVRLHGFVPNEVLTAKTQREYDLWVCCHPQGDPSMAYLESFSNGLPIVGYDNEALHGMLQRVSAGAVVPIYAAEALARVIRDLDGRRRQLADWARTGVTFAKDHTFHRTFMRRVEHFQHVMSTYDQRSGS